MEINSLNGREFFYAKITAQANSTAEKVITAEEKSLSSHRFHTEISCSVFQSFLWLNEL